MTFAERFWSKVRRGADDECWPWTGGLTGKGYGQISDGGGRNFLAHRVSHELAVGAIPADLQVDHLCRNRACVNPRHLELVTSRTNTLRGIGPSAINATKTHCPRGHEYAGDNVYQDARGRRHCRTCGAINARRHRRRLKTGATP